MNDKLFKLAEAIRPAKDEWARRLDSTAAHRRARFVAAAQEHETPRHTVRWIASATALLAAAAAFVIWVAWPQSLEFTVDGDVGVPGAVVVAPTDQPTQLAFSDGSELRAEPGSRFGVDVDDRGAAIELASGAVTLAVRKLPEARWSIRAGPYTVAVVGTEFTTAWSPEDGRLVVDVTEGRVAVSGPDLEQTVDAGDRLVADVEPLAAARKEPDLEPAPAPPKAELPATPPKSRSKRAPAKKKAEQSAWAELAAKGKYDAAFSAASVGGFGRRCSGASAAELAELADIARYAGKTREARDALVMLRKRFASSSGGKRAAYRLGRLEFEQARRYGHAARWFQTYLDEQPRGSLAAAALGRLMESHQHGGKQARAKATAKRYLERFPDGPHADIARSLQR